MLSNTVDSLRRPHTVYTDGEFVGLSLAGFSDEARWGWRGWGRSPLPGAVPTCVRRSAATPDLSPPRHRFSLCSTNLRDRRTFVPYCEALFLKIFHYIIPSFFYFFNGEKTILFKQLIFIINCVLLNSNLMSFDNRYIERFVF